MGKLQQFDINFDKPMAVFQAGEAVNGNVHVVLSRPMKAREMRLKFRGQAYVHWTETRTTGSGDNRRTETVSYSATEDLYDCRVPLWRESSHENKIPAGNHVYPFSFELRMNSPASFEGAYGHLRYWVKATIDKPWKFDHDTKAAFTVICHMDLNMISLAKEPILQQKMEEVGCCSCCQTDPGTVGASLRTDHRGYVPGEQIHSLVEINNDSGDGVVGTVQLKMYTYFRATSKTRSIDKNIATTAQREVTARTIRVWDDFLDIPPIPPTNLGGCRIIGIEYYLKVKINANDGCSCGSLKLGDEIIIGTVPLNLPRFLTPTFPLPHPPTFPPMEGPGPYPPHPEPGPHPPVDGWSPGLAPQPGTPGPGPSHVGASASAAPRFGRQLSTDVPPPSYEECLFMRQTSIKDDDDTEYTRGDLSYAPRYAFYNLRTQPNPDEPPPAYQTSEPVHPDMSRI